MKKHIATIIGYDISNSASDPRVVCTVCLAHAGAGAPPLREGEEWGGYAAPRCQECGTELAGLEIVRPR